MSEQNSGDIKSAYERAMERVANLQGPSKEDRLEWKGVPQGKAHAVKFLKGEGDLAAVLKLADKDVQPFVLRGMVDVLAPNLQLPKTPAVETSLNRSLVGLRNLFRGNKNVEDVLGRVQYVCDQYKNFGVQQRQQIYEDMKRQYAVQMQEAMRRPGASQAPVQVESLPEFQQEWQRIRVQMDKQYDEHLDAFRRELKTAAG